MSIPSKRLISRLKKSEGFRAEPYLCPAGFVTIGYGHNLEADPAEIRAIDPALAAQVEAGTLKGANLLARLKNLGMRWGADEAEQTLLDDVAYVIRQLSGLCPAYTKLAASGDETRAEVLIDMAFNMGVAGLLKFKNTLAAVERGDYDAAASGMLASKWASQVKGRAVELARQMRMGE
ncbi:MAG: glycoside hydrolase family protein [Desulfovibrio sp.]|jgi:lysozyme|nr:glycoside hydrolase family protein [Desulfovibrio sp.]